MWTLCLLRQLVCPCVLGGAAHDTVGLLLFCQLGSASICRCQPAGSCTGSESALAGGWTSLVSCRAPAAGYSGWMFPSMLPQLCVNPFDRRAAAAAVSNWMRANAPLPYKIVVSRSPAKGFVWALCPDPFPDLHASQRLQVWFLFLVLLHWLQPCLEKVGISAGGSDF
jgi:hypothetical protein